MFKTIKKYAEEVIIEKKSKFIAQAFEVYNIEEIEKIINEIRKKHYGAKHNCFAYRILDQNMIIERQSDDGEPSGTAGNPMLGVLQKEGLVNVLIIVTRYFGGILLGTGGLVRAYTDITKLAIEKAEKVEKEKGYVIEVITEYDEQKGLEYLCEKNKINIISKEYTDKIKNVIEISEEKYVKIFQKNEENEFHIFPNSIKQSKYIDKVK